MPKTVRFNIHEAVTRSAKDSELLILIACLVEALGGEIEVSVEQVEDVMRRKELVIERNDNEEDEDDDTEPSITLSVKGYSEGEVN